MEFLPRVGVSVAIGGLLCLACGGSGTTSGSGASDAATSGAGSDGTAPGSDGGTGDRDGLRACGPGSYSVRRLKDLSRIWRAGDVDGDGLSDLVATLGGRLVARRGIGDGGFGEEESVSGVANGSTLHVRDISSDGFSDVAVVSQDGESVYFVSGGPAGLSDARSVRLPDGAPAAEEPVFIELTGDGLVDALVLTSGLGGGPNAIALHQGVDGLFEVAGDLRLGDLLPSADPDVGDVNGDGWEDLLWGPAGAAPEQLLLYGSSEGLGTESKLVPGIGTRFAELDGDGRADLLWSSSGRLDASFSPVSEPPRAFGFSWPRSYPMATHPTLAPVTVDGKHDIVAAFSGTDVDAGLVEAEVLWFSSLDLGEFGEPCQLWASTACESFSSGSRPFRVETASLNRDGVPDLLWYLNDCSQGDGLQVYAAVSQ